MTDDLFTELYYWSVDMPGLDEPNARRVVDWVNREKLTIGACVIDPGSFLTMHVDVATVRALLEALQIAIPSGRLTSGAAQAALSMAEDFEMWLESSSADQSPES